MPEIGIGLRPSATPPSNVPMPSVATIESTPRTTTTNAFTRPTAAAMSSAAITEGTIPQPSLTLSTPTTTMPMPKTPANERSRSPAISGATDAVARMTSAACELKIVWKLADVPNSVGRKIQKRTMTMPQAKSSPKR